jgi:HEAT repeat protein
VTAERSARVSGFALGAMVVIIGLIASLEIGAWSFNLVTGVLNAMTSSGAVRTAVTHVDADLTQLRDSPSPARRIEAIHRLAQRRDPRVTDALRIALRDPDPQVRQAAATLLATLQQRH